MSLSSPHPRSHGQLNATRPRAVEHNAARHERRAPSPVSAPASAAQPREVVAHGGYLLGPRREVDVEAEAEGTVQRSKEIVEVAGHDRSRLQAPQDPRPIVASEDPSRDPRRRRHRRRPEGPRRRGGVRCPGGERAAGHVDLNAVDLPTSVGAGIEAVGVVAGQLAVERDLESKQARAWAHGGLVRGAPATGSIGFPTRPRTPSNVKVVPSGESGRSDLNRRPFGPQPNALPGCATPRGSPDSRAGFRPTSRDFAEASGKGSARLVLPPLPVGTRPGAPIPYGDISAQGRAGGRNRTGLFELGRLTCSLYTTPARPTESRQ
jgi:hypothetical protein